MGFDTGGSETPIIPLIMKDVQGALGLSARLFEKGIYAPAIRPPAVKEPRIRLTVTAAHGGEDLDRLVEALRGA
jgi:7-keto-8-aminopelargonate synthetase-like enzyme